MRDSSAIELVHEGDRSGERKLILFLAGLSGNRSRWIPVISALDPHGASIGLGAALLPNPAIFDGTPSVDELATCLGGAIERGNYTQVVVVAHSAGSFTALELARLRPSVVRACVLVNGGLTTVGHFLDHPLRTFLRDPRTCGQAIRLFLVAGSPAPASIRSAIAKSERVSRAVLGGLVSEKSLQSKTDRQAIFKQGSNTDVLKVLWRNRHYWPTFESRSKEISSTVVFVMGDSDPVSSAEDTRQMAEMLSTARIIEVHGASHAGPDDLSQVIADEVESLLQP